MACVTLVLGAGASRGVTYAHLGNFPSPLDKDFFDLLQRLQPHEKDREAVQFVLEEASSLPAEFRSSMERTFYTLHLRAYLRRKFLDTSDKSEEIKVVRCFEHAIEALLRASHGKLKCDHHEKLVRCLKPSDAVISFNYDLVVERALRPVAEEKGIPFGGHIYGFDVGTSDGHRAPKILKLHGSSNWRLDEGGFSTGRSWKDFDRRPGYLRHTGTGTQFPIFLPFWDKNIEKGPWLDLWRMAYLQLRRSDVLLIWGYSLPPTDVKARELFAISVRDSGRGVKLCVIDLASSTRQRWRDLYPRAQFWEYQNISDFFSYPPSWWSSAPSALD